MTSRAVEFSFFLFDPHFGEGLDDEEDGDQSDMVLFSYPPRSLSVASDEVRSLAAMSLLAQRSTMEDVSTITFLKSKFCVANVSELIMFLGAPSSEADAVLYQQMEFLIDFFSFVSGPLDHMRAASDSKAEFKEKIQNYAKQAVIPCLKRPLGLLQRSFLAIPSCHLPIHANRFFISASQLMTEIRDKYGFVVGSVFFDYAVLASQFDQKETLQLLTLCYSEFDDAENGKVDGPSEMERFYRVYLSPDTLEQFERDGFSVEEFRHRESTSDVKGDDPVVRGAFASLYLFRISRIILGLIIPLAANERLIAKLQQFVKRPLAELGKQVQDTLDSRPEVMVESSKLYDTVFFNGLDGRLQSPVSLDAPHSDLESSFSQGVAFQHNLFCSGPFSQIVSGDHTGFVYGRKVLSQEGFFHFGTPHGMLKDSLQGVERAARDTIRSRHGVHML